MKWNNGIRQIHRWLSIIFTIIVIAVTVIGVVQAAPAEWVYYLPLPPLFLLLFTGLYLFALPYAARWRNGRRTQQTGG